MLREPSAVPPSARQRRRLAQPGRGGSQWLTALADAQRTSWVRTDDKISVAALSKPGFELQWKSSSTTSRAVCTGCAGRHGQRRDAVRADVGRGRQLEQRLRHRQRHRLRRVAAAFRRAVAGSDGACAGGITSAATRIVRAGRRRLPQPGAGSAVAGAARRVSQPARRTRRGRACRRACGRPRPRAGDPAPPRWRRRRGAPAGVEQGAARRSTARACRRLPAREADRRSSAFQVRRGPEENASPFGFLFRPSGVGYVVSSDGMLHVSVSRPARTSSGPRRSCLPTRMVPAHCG